jgi:hypothetical protein
MTTVYAIHTFIQQLSTNFGVTALKTNTISKNKALLETGDWGDSHHLLNDILLFEDSVF